MIPPFGPRPGSSCMRRNYGWAGCGLVKVELIGPARNRPDPALTFTEKELIVDPVFPD